MEMRRTQLPFLEVLVLLLGAAQWSDASGAIICGGVILGRLPRALSALEGEYLYWKQVGERPAYRSMGGLGSRQRRAFLLYHNDGGGSAHWSVALPTSGGPRGTDLLRAKSHAMTPERVPPDAWRWYRAGHWHSIRVHGVSVRCPGQTGMPTATPTVIPTSTEAPALGAVPACVSVQLRGLRSWQVGHGCMGTYFFDRMVNGTPAYFLPNARGLCGSSMLPDGVRWRHRVSLYRSGGSRWVVGEMGGVTFLDVVSHAVSPEHILNYTRWSPHPLGERQPPTLRVRVACPRSVFGSRAPTPLPSAAAAPVLQTLRPTPAPTQMPTPRPTPSPTPPICQTGVLLHGLRRGDPGFKCMGQYTLQIVGERPVYIMYRTEGHNDPCHVLYDLSYRAWVVKRVYGDSFYLLNSGTQISPDQCDQTQWVVPHDGRRSTPAPRVRVSCPAHPKFPTSVPTPRPTPKPAPTPVPTPQHRQYAHVRLEAQFFSPRLAEWRMFQLPEQDAFRQAFADAVGLPLAHVRIISVGPIDMAVPHQSTKFVVGTRIVFEARIDVERRCLDWRSCLHNTVVHQVRAHGFKHILVKSLQRLDIALDAHHVRVRVLGTAMPHDLERGWFATSQPTPSPTPLPPPTPPSPLHITAAPWPPPSSAHDALRGGGAHRSARRSFSSDSSGNAPAAEQRPRALQPGVVALTATAGVWALVLLSQYVLSACKQASIGDASRCDRGAHSRAAHRETAAELGRGEYKPLMTLAEFDAKVAPECGAHSSFGSRNAPLQSQAALKRVASAARGGGPASATATQNVTTTMVSATATGAEHADFSAVGLF